MILIDPRVGSKELESDFYPYDVKVKVSEKFLDADFLFWGNGPDGLVSIGVERKVLSDMISSMRSKRLQGHQLNGLCDHDIVYLVIEGRWRAGKTGMIEVLRRDGWVPVQNGSRGIMYRELDHFITTLTHKCGLIVERTEDRAQTAALLVSRYKWWNDKEWHQHTSHEGIYAPYQPQHGTGVLRRANFTRRTVPDIEKQLAQIDGIDRQAFHIAKVFRCMEDLMKASVEEIANVPVEQNAKGGVKMAKLGKARADKIYKSLRTRWA